MHIVKLRVCDETGLVPAGRYFQQLAKTLRTGNAREATRAEREGDRERASSQRSHRAARHADADTYA